MYQSRRAPRGNASIPYTQGADVACALVSVAVAAIGLGSSPASATVPQPPDEPWIVTEVIDGDTLEVARDSRRS